MPNGNEDLKLPETCRLDRNRLTRIEQQLEALLAEVRSLREFDGPIGQMISQMSANAQRMDAFEAKLEIHDKEIDKIRGNVWTLVWKVIAVGGTGGGAAYLLLEIVAKFLAAG